MNPLVKPYLKWAGGKRQLLAALNRHVPPLNGGQYFEPFLGAGALLLNLQPQRACINDANGQLVLTYRVIRDDVEQLIEQLEAHRRRHTEPYYYEVRSQDRDADRFAAMPDVEKAARLIYLNKTCYNGLYRVNSRGMFNVPYGRQNNPAICEAPVLRAVSCYLNDNKIIITNLDFAEAVQEADNQAFIYFDPPYHSADRTSFTGYQARGFDENEQIRLCRVFTQLADRGAKCMLSNSDTEFIRALYSDPRFTVETVQAKRAINSVAAGRTAVSEVLVRSWR